MQLEQNFDLPEPPLLAWPAFQDFGLLIDCLPGASLTGPAADGVLPLRFDVKLGPISAGFIGSGRATIDEAAMGGRFEGDAADKRTQSRVKGAASFALSPQGSGTRVNVVVDYTLTGSLAQFGRGAIVRELASALTAQFAANLAARLADRRAAPPSQPAPAPADEPAAAAAPAIVATASPLSVWSLLKLVLAARWQRLRH